MESGADAGLLECGGEDAAELGRGGALVGRLGDAGAGEELFHAGSLQAPDLGEGVLRLPVDDDRHVVDGADLTLHHVAVLVAHCEDRVVLALAGESIEPAGELGMDHEGPLAPGQHDRPPGLGLGACDDAPAHLRHPVVVARAVRHLPAVDAVGAVDGVDLLGPVALEVLRPADAEVPSDCVGRGVNTTLIGWPVDLAVVGVGPLTGGQTTGVTLGDGSH